MALRDTIATLAAEFADGILRALREASLEEVLSGDVVRPGRAQGVAPRRPVVPAATEPERARPVGTRPARSLTDLSRVAKRTTPRCMCARNCSSSDDATPSLIARCRRRAANATSYSPSNV